MVATVVSEELHATTVVRFCVVPSVYDPVAVNCCFVPLAILGLFGVSEMDRSVAGVTVKVVDPIIPPDDALIATEPTAVAVVSPCIPEVLLISATDPSETLQRTASVRFCVELSENIPVAMNC